MFEDGSFFNRIEDVNMATHVMWQKIRERQNVGCLKRQSTKKDVTGKNAIQN